MPSPESISFHNHDQLGAALLEFLEIKGDDDDDRHISSNTQTNQAEFAIAGATIKLPKELKRLLKDMQKIAPEQSTAKQYLPPVLIIVGETTKYRANQVIESLQEETTPELIFCTLSSGSNESGLAVVFKNEANKTIFSSQELIEQDLQDLPAEQKIEQTLQAFFQSEAFTNQDTNKQPLITLSNYSLDVFANNRPTAHVHLNENKVLIKNKE